MLSSSPSLARSYFFRLEGRQDDWDDDDDDDDGDAIHVGFLGAFFFKQ